jgi:signal transduction histidine kinase
VVYGIVKNHGGFIVCFSESGVGTTFKIYFPATKKEVKLATRIEMEV